MTDRSKFEEMLERLVNEDRAGAEELFHEIVVEASREIYQSILESEDEDEDLDEESEEEDDEELDEESDEEDDEELDEMFGLDEFAPGDGSDDAMGMGGDATDGMMGDVADDGDDMDSLDGDEMGDDAGLSDRMDDLEDQLAQLTAEFDKIMPGEAEEEEHEDEFGSEEGEEEGGEEDEMDFGDEEDDTEEKESFAFEAKKQDAKMKADAAKKKAETKKTAGEEMREYVEKIGGDRYNAYGKMGDNGANTKSLVAGKNDMGGTTANILASKNGEKGVEANKGQLKGNGVFKGTPKDMNTKNVNVPGSKTATKLSPVAKGHGAEKKGAGETADKSAGSMLNGAPKRAK